MQQDAECKVQAKIPPDLAPQRRLLRRVGQPPMKQRRGCREKARDQVYVHGQESEGRQGGGLQYVRQQRQVEDIAAARLAVTT